MRDGSSPFAREPVLAACGLSGSGKTTLVEAAIPLLLQGGLAVAAVKHDAHGLQLDLPHKDSGRMFAAGADVGLSGPGEDVLRRHRAGSPDLAAMLRTLLAYHDVVLVEGHKSTPVPKVWLPTAEAPAPPAEVCEVEAVLPLGEGRLPAFMDLLWRHILDTHRTRTLRGGLLLGGQSRRMGRPKHLIELGGRSLLEHVGGLLRERTNELVLLGRGELPADWSAVTRLPDPPGLQGPLAGLLAALRWAPRTTWLMVACDMPDISPQALSWLLGERRPGRWAILPEVEEGRVEPLLAVYEPQIRPLLEGLAGAGRRAPRELVSHPRVHRPRVPEALRSAWRNVNAPEDLLQT